MFEDKDVSHRSIERILHDLQATFGAVPKKLVLGGDFNMWIQPWNGAPWPDYANTFRHITDDLRMVDCLQTDVGPSRGPLRGCPCGGSEGCRHVRTLRHMNRESSTPWQVDYIFASFDLQPPRLRSCELIDGEDVWANSDHCVVVATFDIPEAV